MKIHQLACAMLSMAVLVGCSKTEETKPQANATPTTATTTAEPAQKPAESYTVISQTAYPPFASLDEKGNLIGFDVDILKAIAEKQNIGFSFVPTSQNVVEMLDAVDKETAHLVMTGINITEKRLQHYDFSEPYLMSNWVVLLDKRHGKQINNFDELANQPIAVQQLSASETQLADTKITDKPVLVKGVYLGVRELQQKNAVGVYDVDSVLAKYLTDSNLYLVADKKSGQIPVGFALKKGNTALKEKIDAGLAQIKQDGTYDKLVAKWFNGAITSDSQPSASASTAK